MVGLRRQQRSPDAHPDVPARRCGTDRCGGEPEPCAAAADLLAPDGRVTMLDCPVHAAIVTLPRRRVALEGPGWPVRLKAMCERHRRAVVALSEYDSDRFLFRLISDIFRGAR